MITAKKKQYIITNHYDMCAISSSNVKVAVAVAYVLGQGRFGLKEASTGKIVLFPHQNPLQVIHIKTEKDINAFFDKHNEALAECFESFRYMDKVNPVNDLRKTAEKYAVSFRAKAQDLHERR